MDTVSRECTAFAAPMAPLVRLRFVACQIGFKGISRPVGVTRVHPPPWTSRQGLLPRHQRAKHAVKYLNPWIAVYKDHPILGVHQTLFCTGWEERAGPNFKRAEAIRTLFLTPDSLYNIHFLSRSWDSKIYCIQRWFKSPSVVGPSMPRQKLPWPKLLNSSRSYGGRTVGSDGCTSGVAS